MVWVFARSLPFSGFATMANFLPLNGTRRLISDGGPFTRELLTVVESATQLRRAQRAILETYRCRALAIAVRFASINLDIDRLRANYWVKVCRRNIGATAPVNPPYTSNAHPDPAEAPKRPAPGIWLPREDGQACGRTKHNTPMSHA